MLSFMNIYFFVVKTGFQTFVVGVLIIANFSKLEMNGSLDVHQLHKMAAVRKAFIAA